MPPTYTTDAVYGLRALTGSNLISDIDAGFTALRDDAAAKLKGAVPRVSSLPTVGPSGSGALVDGQECYLIADATNGVQWHLRYNAGSVSTYKWEFVGGEAIYAENNSSGNVATSGSAQDLVSGAGPSVVLPALPAGGEFLVSHGAAIQAVSAPGTGITSSQSFQVAATSVLAADAATFIASAVGGASVMRTVKKTVNASGSAITIACKYSTNGTATNWSWFNRWISALPIRVG